MHVFSSSEGLSLAVVAERVKITEIRDKGRQGKKVSVYVNGAFWKTLSKELLYSCGIKEEQEISVEELEKIGLLIERVSAENYCFRLLSFRGRSIKEIGSRLGLAGFSGEVIESVVAGLKEKGYLDDIDFARMWAEERFNSGKYGKRRIRQELSGKGVERTIIDSQLSLLSEREEREHALELVFKKYRGTATSDPLKLQRRVYQFLLRRGFDAELAREAIAIVCSETEAGPGRV